MSDSEYEEEEFIVYADFGNQLEPIGFSGENKIKIIGLESKQPIAEINGNIFRGTYDFSIGTNIFFEKDLNAHPKVCEVVPAKDFKFSAKTNKVINFRRIYVEKNSDDAVDNTKNSEMHDDLKIDLTHEEAIKLFPSAEYEN